MKTTAKNRLICYGMFILTAFFNASCSNDGSESTTQQSAQRYQAILPAKTLRNGIPCALRKGRQAKSMPLGELIGRGPTADSARNNLRQLCIEHVSAQCAFPAEWITSCNLFAQSITPFDTHPYVAPTPVAPAPVAPTPVVRQYLLTCTASANGQNAKVETGYNTRTTCNALCSKAVERLMVEVQQSVSSRHPITWPLAWSATCPLETYTSQGVFYEFQFRKPPSSTK